MTTMIEAEATKGHGPWTKTSESYNTNVGRASKQAASALMKKANARHTFDARDVRIIDLGAGTGSMTLTIAEAFPNATILATDISEAMLSKLRRARAVQLDGSDGTVKQDLVTTRVLDMQEPCVADGEPPGSYTHAISTFVMMVLVDPQAAIHGMYTLLKPNSGSIAAIALWDFSRQCDPHEIWEEAATVVDPNYRNPPRNITSSWDSRENVEEGMKKAGFEDVDGELFKVRFDTETGTDGFIDFFWQSQNPMTVERKRSWPGDLGLVKVAMRDIVDERIRSGKGIWIDVGLVVGTKP